MSENANPGVTGEPLTLAEGRRAVQQAAERLDRLRRSVVEDEARRDARLAAREVWTPTGEPACGVLREDGLFAGLMVCNDPVGHHGRHATSLPIAEHARTLHRMEWPR